MLDDWFNFNNLEVYKSIFKITQETNKFELYTDNFDKFSIPELKKELDEIISFSDIAPEHLRHELIGPCTI